MWYCIVIYSIKEDVSSLLWTSIVAVLSLSNISPTENTHTHWLYARDQQHKVDSGSRTHTQTHTHMFDRATEYTAVAHEIQMALNEIHIVLHLWKFINL